jgi:hypothetical protein
MIERKDLKFFSCCCVINRDMLNFFALSENGNKRIGRIRQEYFSIYGEYADRHKIKPFSANFYQNNKNSDPKSPFLNMVDGQKITSRHCPFNPPSAIMLTSLPLSSFFYLWQVEAFPTI